MGMTAFVIIRRRAGTLNWLVRAYRQDVPAIVDTDHYKVHVRFYKRNETV